MIHPLEYQRFHLSDISGFKRKMLNWLKQFGIFCFLDNQQYNIAPHKTEWLVAAGVKEAVLGSDVRKIDTFLKNKAWVFGHLSYELLHSAHQISTRKPDPVGFPPFYFFVPQIILEYNQELKIYGENANQIFEAILEMSELEKEVQPICQLVPRLSKEAYIEKINALQEHIHRGDCYEINFCQEFFADHCTVDPFSSFQKLMDVSPNPFSVFYRLDDKFLLCASPERFLTKKAGRVFSQPIKGTMKRNLQTVAEDVRLMHELRNSQKEQAENVMVVDLVRNDLTRICKDASVKVDELFGIYSYPQVHQMISTISGELKDDISFADILHATFPMGSMTGAPKHHVMQLIEEYEASARGIFSGSVGYFHPDGDFDFNVIIRSIMYNSISNYLSYQVGSGITFYSQPENEWDECLLKAEAIKEVLSY